MVALTRRLIARALEDLVSRQAHEHRHYVYDRGLADLRSRRGAEDSGRHFASSDDPDVGQHLYSAPARGDFDVLAVRDRHRQRQRARRALS